MHIKKIMSLSLSRPIILETYFVICTFLIAMIYMPLSRGHDAAAAALILQAKQSFRRTNKKSINAQYASKDLFPILE